MSEQQQASTETKVLFLDIDGVLNSAPFVEGQAETLAMHDLEWWIEMIDPKAVKRLNQILFETAAIVVISSTWRLRLDDAELQQVLSRAGFEGTLWGATERSNRGTRGSRVTDWLAAHPEVTRFVILDDEPEQEPHLAAFVQTTWEKGLTDAHRALVISVLER